MVNIYSIRIDSYIDSEIYDYLLQLVSEEKRAKIKKFKFLEDGLRCLLGNLLSRYAIIKRTGYKNNELKFSVTEYNKPILTEPDKSNFNISHSGNWAVCAISDAPVGIDVELIKTIELEIAKRFFTNYEYTCLMKQSPADLLKFFYTLWTLKESYIKADGRGLSIPLDTFSIDVCNDQISLITNNELNSCYFRSFSLDERHIASVCSLTDDITDSIEEVTVNDLIQILV